MLRFFLRRAVIALLVAITVSIVGFALLRASGDLATVLAGENARAEDVAAIARANGLDRPVAVQYLDWVGRALHGDLGRSLFSQEPVTRLILDRIWVTVGVALPSLLLALLLAVPLGVLAAVRANSWIDRAALTIAVFGQAIPSFWFALILIFVFGVVLRWTPVSGSTTVAHFILPVITLGVSIMPSFMRLTRAGMIEILSADFIRTARAKGLGEATVLFRHGLRHAILPVISLAAVQLGVLLGGSVIVETVFALNGIGYLAYQSITRIDFPVVQAVLIVLSLAYIVLTLVADIINARLDPRIRL
jgi:peptide/nickel transport system permease protein